jgi:hypothetical protein
VTAPTTGLSDRLAALPEDDDDEAAEGATPAEPPPAPHPATPEGRAAAARKLASSPRAVRRDVLRETKENVRALVLRDVVPRLRTLEGAALQADIRTTIDRVLRQEDVRVSPRDRQALVDEMMADTLGYGPLDPLLFEDESVTEIMCNGYDEVWVERERPTRGGRASRSPTRPTTAPVIERMVMARSAGGSTRARRWSTPGSPTGPG